MGGRSSSSGMTSSSSRSAGGGPLGMSPSAAASGFFTDSSHSHWAGTVAEGRASAVNISEVYKDSYTNPLASQRATGELDDVARARAAERDIENIARQIVARNVPRDQLKGPNVSSGPMGNDPRATLGDAAYNALRKAIIDEARSYANGNTRARRDYRSMY